jgi:hypothetical protein
MSSEAARKAWETRRSGLAKNPDKKPDIPEGDERIKEFYKTLKLCFKFVSDREFASLGFKCFKFEGKTVKAFAKDKGIQHDIPYDFGECFVQADLLMMTLADFLDKKDVRIEVRNGFMHFEADSLRAQIELSEPEETFRFPRLPVEFKPLPLDFFETIKHVEFAMMHDPANFSKLSAIFVNKNVFYATNNITIARYASDLNLESLVMPDELVSLHNKDSVLEGYYIDDKFWLKYDGYVVFVNMIEKPLDVKRLKDSFKTSPKDQPICEYDQDDVLRSLKGVRSHTEGKSKRMTFELQKDRMIFIARNEAGEVCSEVRCNYSGEPASYIFAYDQLMACFKRSKKFSKDEAGGRCRLYFQEGALELLLISLIE